MAHSLERFMTLEQIRGLVTADFEAVDRVVKQRLAQPGSARRSGGRLTLYTRAASACAPFWCFWRRAPAGIRRAAHRGSRHHRVHPHRHLLHDDVVDGSSLRRGRETANEVFGNATSVLVGDFLYSRAFQMMVRSTACASWRFMADATNAIAEGEVLQLMNAHDPTPARRATSTSFAARRPAFRGGRAIGAVLSDAPPIIEESLARFGGTSAPPFSWSTMRSTTRPTRPSLGKHLGDDLAEGKPTLPVIYAMQHGNDEQRHDSARHRGRRTRSSCSEITRAVASLGGLAYTARLAQCEADQALAALAPLPESAFKEGLSELAKFAVARKH
jgi:octaprenyl-diphosphate synthase